MRANMCQTSTENQVNHWRHPLWDRAGLILVRSVFDFSAQAPKVVACAAGKVGMILDRSITMHTEGNTNERH